MISAYIPQDHTFEVTLYDELEIRRYVEHAEDPRRLFNRDGQWVIIVGNYTIVRKTFVGTILYATFTLHAPGEYNIEPQIYSLP